MDVPANPHQELVWRLFSALTPFVNEKTDEIYPGVNVSDRDDWKSDYRIPDVAAYLFGDPAENRRTHCLGGPDLAVENVSRNDRTNQKLDFHTAVGTRELIVIDRSDERLELHRLIDGTLTRVGTLTTDSGPITTESVPLPWLMKRADQLQLILTGSAATGSVIIEVVDSVVE